MLKIDHVAIIPPNLATTAWQLQSAGLASHDGGYAYVKEGDRLRGTMAYRGVPLGNDQYIEIEQVIDDRPVSEAPNDLARSILELRDRAVRDGPILLAFWVISDDFEGHRDRLRLPEQLHQRVKPDGSLDRSRSAPRSIDAIRQGFPPFCAYMNPMEEHPSRVPVVNPVAPVGLAWLEVGGERSRMEEWLGPEAGSLPLRYVGGGPGLRGMGVALESGELIEIRPGGAFLDIRRR